MSTIHRPERKHAVTVRFTETDMHKLKVRARSEDRSLNSLVTRIVRAELDSMDAKEIAE